MTEANTGCFRSTGNYPSLLAEALKIERFTDVSCSGAETSHVTEPQVTLADTTVPPQLDAVRRNTELVTVGLGGNDFALFAQGIMRLSDVPEDAPREIGERLVEVLDTIRDRAPRAAIVLVGYPRIVSPATSCPRLLPFSKSEQRAALSLQTRLNEAMRDAAERADALFVDLFPASRGHDVCSKQPWVNGRRNLPGKATAYHPFAAAMAGVAREIELTLAAHGSMLG